MSNKAISRKQDQIVTVKQHNAITEARYEMSALEKNIVYILLSQLQDEDSYKKKYTVHLKELQERLAIAGRKCNRDEFEESTKRLMTLVYEIYEDSGDFLQVALIASAKHIRYNDMNDTVELELSPDIRPYLFHLKNNFTEFELQIAFSLKSKYSQRIYEILSKYKDTGIMHITVEKLKDRLGLIDPKKKEEKYKEWSIFSDRVLEGPRKEIQKCTDISFTYTLTKTGRKYTDITFYIKNKPVQTLLELNI